MLRSALGRKLRKMEDIKIPEGHTRVHKRVTTYFFSESKRPQVESFLAEQGLVNKGQAMLYARDTIHWKTDDNSRSVFIHAIEPGWISIAILAWPA